MRFLRRRVWRAIPELEGLTDERAKAFVKATQNLGLWRAARWGVTGFAYFPVLWAWGGVLWLAARMTGSSFDNWMDGRGVPKLVFALLVVSFFVVPILVCLVIRRWFVLRAVRSALSRRCVCAKCGVIQADALLNAGVGEAACCSNCEAVPAAGVLREAGRPGSAGSSLLVWRWARRVATVVVVTVLVLIGWVGWGEWTLRRDARQAAEDRTGVLPLQIMWLERQPEGTKSSDANAWLEFHNALDLIAKVDAEVWPPAGPGEVSYPPLYDALDNTLKSGSPEKIAEYDAGRALAERMLEPLRAAGVYDAWRRMRSAPRREQVIVLPAGEPAVSLAFPEMNQLRQVSRMNKARMVVAAREGRMEEFCDALANETALAGMSAEIPTIVASLVSCAIDAMAFRQVRLVLSKHPSKEWLDAMEAAIKPDRPRPPRSYGLKADRAIVLDSLAYAFAKPEFIRKKRWEAWFGDDYGSRRPVGTYAQSRADLDGSASSVVAAADLERFARPQLARQESPLALVVMLDPHSEKALRSMDQIEVERRGQTVMIALERFRLAHGAYPERLEELVPDQLAAVPLDPWSGRPLCYRRGGAPGEPADAQGWGYRLWSVGADGRDDGGKMVASEDDRYAVLASGKFVGFDFIINDTKR